MRGILFIGPGGAPGDPCTCTLTGATCGPDVPNSASKGESTEVEIWLTAHCLPVGQDTED